MRRVVRSIEREPNGAWVIRPDHLDKVERFEVRQLRNRPVTVEILSAVPINKMPTVEAATWLDRELVADAAVPVRDTGFGREVRTALAERRQWLVTEQLAEGRSEGTVYRPGVRAAQQRGGLLRLAGPVLTGTGVDFCDAR